VGEVAASSQSLQEQAQRLAEVVARFQLAAAAPEAVPGLPAVETRREPRLDLRGAGRGISEPYEVPRLTTAE